MPNGTVPPEEPVGDSTDSRGTEAPFHTVVRPGDR